MSVSITVHADDPAARWRAIAEVKHPTKDSRQYGGYGTTPLEATTRLAETGVRAMNQQEED